MSAINLSATMDALATAITSNLIKRVYAWPVTSVSAPCAVVAYPTELEFDATMGRGSDRAVFPIYFVAGNGNDRNTRDELSRIITGTDSIKNSISGDLDGAVSSAEVINVSITEINVGGVAYTAAQFDVVVYT